MSQHAERNPLKSTKVWASPLVLLEQPFAIDAIISYDVLGFIYSWQARLSPFIFFHVLDVHQSLILNFYVRCCVSHQAWQRSSQLRKLHLSRTLGLQRDPRPDPNRPSWLKVTLFLLPGATRNISCTARNASIFATLGAEGVGLTGFNKVLEMGRQNL